MLLIRIVLASFRLCKDVDLGLIRRTLVLNGLRCSSRKPGFSWSWPRLIKLLPPDHVARWLKFRFLKAICVNLHPSVDLLKQILYLGVNKLVNLGRLVKVFVWVLAKEAYFVVEHLANFVAPATQVDVDSVLVKTLLD